MVGNPGLPALAPPPYNIVTTYCVRWEDEVQANSSPWLAEEEKQKPKVRIPFYRSLPKFKKRL